MPNLFFNNNFKVPYIRFESADGEIKLGRNTPITRENNYTDGIHLEDVTVEVGSDVAVITVKISVLFKEWSNSTFADKINKLVEEPYTTITQKRNGERVSKTEGIWLLQFGWKTNSYEESLTPEIKCVTTQNDITVMNESNGSIQITKTLVMLPMIYLNQTFLSQLKKVNAYVTQQTNESENTTQANIIPKRIFELLVQDLQAVHGETAPGLPKLENFLFAAQNFLNIPASTVYDNWVNKPLENLSSLNTITMNENKDKVSVMAWLVEMLYENGMKIVSTPLRTFSAGGDLGFIIRVADTEEDGRLFESYEVRADQNTQNTNFYRYQWEPTLDIFKRDGIIEAATFTFNAGEYSAAYYEGFRRVFVDRKDPRVGIQTSDANSEEVVRNKSLYYEALKLPGKKISLTIMGQPKLSVLDFIRVETNNELFNGQYTILNIIHTLSNGEFMTTVDCIRKIVGNGKPKNVNVGG